VLRLTVIFSVWTDAVRVNVTKVLWARACNSPGGGGYRAGKQVGGTAPLSKSPDLEARITGEIVWDPGDYICVSEIQPRRKNPYRKGGIGWLY